MTTKTCGCTTETCGCCEGSQALTPQSTINRPGLSALSYRVGTHGAFFETMKARLSTMTVDVPSADGQSHRDLHATARPNDAGRGRLFHRAARRLGHGRGRPHVLSGAHRERRLSAHGHGAPLDSRARAAARLHVAAGRGGDGLSGLHDRREPDDARANSRWRTLAEHSGTRRIAAEFRDERSTRPRGRTGTICKSASRSRKTSRRQRAGASKTFSSAGANRISRRAIRCCWSLATTGSIRFPYRCRVPRVSSTNTGPGSSCALAPALVSAFNSLLKFRSAIQAVASRNDRAGQTDSFIGRRLCKPDLLGHGDARQLGGANSSAPARQRLADLGPAYTVFGRRT